MKFKVTRDTINPFTYVVEDMNGIEFVVDLHQCFIGDFPDLIGKTIEINNWEAIVYAAEDCRII